MPKVKLTSFNGTKHFRSSSCLESEKPTGRRGMEYFRHTKSELDDLLTNSFREMQSSNIKTVLTDLELNKQVQRLRDRVTLETSNRIINVSSMKPNLMKAVLDVEEQTSKAENQAVRQSIRDYYHMKKDTNLKKILE